MKQRIIDSTSGDEVTGRIGRFTATTYRRGEVAPRGGFGIYEGVRGATVAGRGKRALTAALTDAAEQRANARPRDWVTVVSLYDAVTRVWWPCHIAE